MKCFTKTAQRDPYFKWTIYIIVLFPRGKKRDSSTLRVRVEYSGVRTPGVSLFSPWLFLNIKCNKNIPFN